MNHKATPTRSSIFEIPTPPALPLQRIGVMGGSFNPAHDGHQIVARTALRRLNLDRLWWLVTPGNPLKNLDDLAPLKERMNKAKRFATDPRMEITAFEQQLNSPYTATTLAFLKKRYPRTRFVWVMGADNLASFHKWQNWHDIVSTLPIAVIDRPGWHLKALASPAARSMAGDRIPETSAGSLPALKPPVWSFLTTRLSNLSSSALRQESQR